MSIAVVIYCYCNDESLYPIDVIVSLSVFVIYGPQIVGTIQSDVVCYMNDYLCPFVLLTHGYYTIYRTIYR